jgi:tetratricopeptide (TPR) repeat protein
VLLAVALRRFGGPVRVVGAVPEAYASWFMTAAGILFAAVPPVNADLRWRASRLLSQAKGLSQAGSFAEAIPRYEKALQADPGNAEARYFLGASLQDRNQAGDLAAAEKAYGLLRASHPDYVLVHMKLAMLYDAQGKKEAALAEYARQSELDPYLAAAWEGQARLLYQAGKREEAMRTLDQGLELQPADPGLLSSRGLVLVEAGRMDEGLKAFEAVLKANPGMHEARLNYAVSLLRAGRRGEAAGQAELVLKARPEDAAAEHVLRLAKGR